MQSVLTRSPALSEHKAKKLIESLERLRELLEQLQAELKLLQSKRELSISEEEKLVRVEYDLHLVTYEHLPWARLSPNASRAAEITRWLHGRWSKYFGG